MSGENDDLLNTDATYWGCGLYNIDDPLPSYEVRAKKT